MRIKTKKETLELGRRINAMRIVMSWIRAGGSLEDGARKDGFADWVNSLEGLSQDDKDLIIWTADNGKFEYEESAKRFLMNR